MRTADIDARDPTFVEDLKQSADAVRRAAQWLSEKGYPVIIRPTFIRPTADKMAEFSDNGDLEIKQRVEVKRRLTTDFTSRNDFPFQTVIVDVCHAYDNARPKPYCYIIFNRLMTCSIVVDCKATKASWERTEKNDAGKGRMRAFYECPIGLVSFERITLDQGAR